MSIPATRSTPEQLLAAYVAETGYPVSMSHARHKDLRQICLMPAMFNADDVRAVIEVIKFKIKKGHHGWVPASLHFRNAMRPEQFEEWALQCREHAVRRKPNPVKIVAQTDCLGTTRLTEALIDDPPRADFLQGFKEMKAKIAPGGSGK